MTVLSDIDTTPLAESVRTFLRRPKHHLINGRWVAPVDGRELGINGIDGYLETTAVNIAL
jgi:hypothetical protein